jgi:hypothetical protein
VRHAIAAGIALTSLLSFACGGAAPLPTAPESKQGFADDPGSGLVPVGATAGAVALHRPNTPPTMDLRTRPAAAPGDPYPVISGLAPLAVNFNVCRTADPDMEPDGENEPDSLNWQIHFGDGKPISEGPDFEHFCRTEHTYEEGRYVATISVTDKHLEDQDDFSSLARDTTKLTIEAYGEPEPPASLPQFPSATGCLYTGLGSFYFLFSGGYTQGFNPGVSYDVYNSTCTAVTGSFGGRYVYSPAPYDPATLCTAAFGTGVQSQYTNEIWRCN